MARLTSAERRLQYLETAADLLTESLQRQGDQSGLAVAHVRLEDVAELAGVSKGALYHFWPAQEDYWSDLLHAMFNHTRSFGPRYDHWVRSAAAPENKAAPPTFGELTNQIFTSRSENPTALVRVALASYPTSSEVGTSLSSEMIQIATIYGVVIDSVLTSAKRRLRPGYDSLAVIMMIGAAVNGLAVRQQYGPAAVIVNGLDDDIPNDLFSLITEALITYYSEPVTPGPENDYKIGHLLRLPLDRRALDKIWAQVNHPAPETVTQLNSDDPRALYIRAGLDLLWDASATKLADASVSAMGNIRIADVADRVGVSKGSIYHLWPNQEAFRLDVLRHVLKSSSDVGMTALGAHTAPAHRRRATAWSTIADLADLAFDFVKDNDRFYARFSYSLFGAHPDVTAILADGDIEIRSAFNEALLESLETESRMLRKPIDSAALQTAAESLLYGSALTYRVAPSIFDGHRESDDEGHDSRSGRAISRYAEAMSAVCQAWSTPLESR